jgi:hypothetical protein
MTPVDGRPGDEVGGAVRERLSLLIDSMRAPDRQAAGGRFLAEVGSGLKRRIQLLQPGARQGARDTAAKMAISRERAVRAAVSKAIRLLPEERVFD